MTLSPTLIAGYQAVTELLAGKNVRIKDPEQSAMEFAMLMRSHSVNVACWIGHVVVTHVAEYADAADIESVPYPVSHEDPDFTEKLGELLLPTVDKYLSRLPVSR